MRVVACLAAFHDPRLVALAVAVCLGGAYVTVELYSRVRERSAVQQVGWIFMSAIAAGCSVWCTHFIAMLAYRTEIPASYDPVLTLGSLLVVIAGSALAFHIAATREGWPGSALAGLVLGASIAAMHYSGMAAYRIEGVVTWQPGYVLASVAASIAFGMFFFNYLNAGRRWLALTMFILAVAALHFIGMAAVSVEPLLVDPLAASDAEGLAVAITGGVLLILGASIASHLIDSDVNEKNLGVLRHLALNDGLTGIPNRTHFADHLDREIARAQIDGRKLAVMVIDLDKFKGVNDVHGHGAGDTVLRVVSERITGMLKDGEFFARMGGDEFAMVKRFVSETEIHDLTDRLEAMLLEPIYISDFDVIVGGSVGISLFPSDADSAARLIGNADLAMYRAKADLARNCCYYEPLMDEVARGRRELAGELRKAIELGQLELRYQAQTDFISDETIGYEALLRWNHPQRGWISPVDFIPLAEETGLILPIGEWVLHTACAEAASWDSGVVAVNLSAVQLAHADLPQLVSHALTLSGLPPHRLELEITETAIIRNKAKALQAMESIRALGVTIAIDDFGTGYSSLETLRSFPFDRIKVDRSFTSELGHDPQSLAIVRAVLALGRSLGIRVLVEGVETEQQLSVLKLEGCSQAQGFFFGVPTTPELLGIQRRPVLAL